MEMHDVQDPVQVMHETSASAAPEVKKELPLNPQEVPRASTLSTTRAANVQSHGSNDQHRSAPEPWWTSHAGIDRKGRMLGVLPRPGEPYDEYKRRLIEVEHAQRQRDASGGSLITRDWNASICEPTFRGSRA